LKLLQEKLDLIDENLKRKIRIKKEYDRLIEESEEKYDQVKLVKNSESKRIITLLTIFHLLIID